MHSDQAQFKIQMLGVRSKEFKVCWEIYFKKMGITDAAEIRKIKKKYVWHHLDDLNENYECTM
jgi:hypothetical protein